MRVRVGRLPHRPPPRLPKAEATRLQITAYGKALRPVVKADEALWRKISRVQALVGSNTNAFSMAARIDDSYLPALVQIQTRLAAIKAPPGFRTVQARLEQVCSVQNDFLFFLQDSLRRALYTHTAQPGFAAAQRYIARWKKAVREYDLAVLCGDQAFGREGQAAAPDRHVGLKPPCRTPLTAKGPAAPRPPASGAQTDR